MVLITDERSMISSQLLAATERNIRENVLGGISGTKCFGGVPVVMLIGDDNQLPPVSIMGQGKGAFCVFDNRSHSKKGSQEMMNENKGMDLFK